MALSLALTNDFIEAPWERHSCRISPRQNELRGSGIGARFWQAGCFQFAKNFTPACPTPIGTALSPDASSALAQWPTTNRSASSGPATSRSEVKACSENIPGGLATVKPHRLAPPHSAGRGMRTGGFWVAHSRRFAHKIEFWVSQARKTYGWKAKTTPLAPLLHVCMGRAAPLDEGFFRLRKQTFYFAQCWFASYAIRSVPSSRAAAKRPCPPRYRHRRKCCSDGCLGRAVARGRLR